MDLKRASEIVSAMVKQHTGAMIEDTPPDIPSWLAEVSLADMLEAQGIVKADNDARGSGTMHVICDDRLVAAYYVLIHYPPRRTRSGMYEPIVYTKARALVCCDAAAFKHEDEDEQEESRAADWKSALPA